MFNLYSSSDKSRLYFPLTGGSLIHLFKRWRRGIPLPHGLSVGKRRYSLPPLYAGSLPEESIHSLLFRRLKSNVTMHLEFADVM